MMAQKHLHELLQEDQEPFQLKNYIADRRSQLKTSLSSSKTQLQVKKRKPISQRSNFTSNFCKNACLFSLQDSPDPRKSPFFEFPSPAKSPCRSSNAIFLHIPARTAALLLEAAQRIQKQSSNAKTQNKNASFSLFGSLRKKLTPRNKTRKLESSGDEVKVSVKDLLRWDSSVGRTKASNEKKEIFKEQMVGAEEKSAFEMGFSCSWNGRPSSAVWSESNEDKSLDLDLETSCSSSHCEDSEEEIEFVSKDKENADFDSHEKHFCESPFRFVLQKSPSSGCRTPDFSSPATSPSRHAKEDKENHEVEILKKLQVKEDEEEEGEEEKEQCSPVSVLDPPFEDDEEEDEEGHEDEDEDDEEGFDLECSYAIVQRAKRQLLHKLRRFEKLAELDPIELEKRMSALEEEDDDNDSDDTCDLEEEEDSEDYETNMDGFIKEVVSQSDYHHHHRRIPQDMKRLIGDLIAEEEREQNRERAVVVKRVCRRLESWKEVESNTIDMMVEQDIRREVDGWNRNDKEQVGETAVEIELSIFGLLMEELSEELAV